MQSACGHGSTAKCIKIMFSTALESKVAATGFCVSYIITLLLF